MRPPPAASHPCPSAACPFAGIEILRVCRSPVHNLNLQLPVILRRHSLAASSFVKDDFLRRSSVHHLDGVLRILRTIRRPLRAVAVEAFDACFRATDDVFRCCAVVRLARPFCAVDDFTALYCVGCCVDPMRLSVPDVIVATRTNGRLAAHESQPHPSTSLLSIAPVLLSHAPCAARLFLQRHRNLARVATCRCNRNLARGLLADALELLAPLHQHQRIRREQLIQPQRLQLPLAFQPYTSRWNSFTGLPSRVPSYSCSSVNVGLVTSSGSAASSACAIPFTSVVLPVPRSPRRISNCGGTQQIHQLAPHFDRVGAALCYEFVNPSFGDWRFLAHCVASAERTAQHSRRGSPCNQTYPLGCAFRKAQRPKLKRTRKIFQAVGRKQSVLIRIAHSKIGGKSMQINRRLHRARNIVFELRQQPRDHPGQQIAAAALGHSRIARGIHRDPPVRMSDQRPRSLQHQRHTMYRAQNRAPPRDDSPESLSTLFPASRAISPGCGVNTTVRPAFATSVNFSIRNGFAASVFSPSASMTIGIFVSESTASSRISVSLVPAPVPDRPQSPSCAQSASEIAAQ